MLDLLDLRKDFSKFDETVEDHSRSQPVSACRLRELLCCSHSAQMTASSEGTNRHEPTRLWGWPRCCDSAKNVNLSTSLLAQWLAPLPRTRRTWVHIAAGARPFCVWMCSMFLSGFLGVLCVFNHQKHAYKVNSQSVPLTMAVCYSVFSVYHSDHMLNIYITTG